MPFGASSSVWAWDRVGAALVWIARVVLRIPLLRYVDDLHTAERSECIEHCKMCVVRLVRALLGEGSIAQKYSSGLPLEVLGIVVDADCSGVSLWPSADKVAKWSAEIDCCLASSAISAGAAKKLAGKLLVVDRVPTKQTYRAVVSMVWFTPWGNLRGTHAG